jgi:hypothetical protein
MPGLGGGLRGSSMIAVKTILPVCRSRLTKKFDEMNELLS